MLQQLANLGSFIGGVGVLLTVVYLAIQIRQNTKSNRGASYQAAVAAISEWSRQVGLDRSAARIVSAGTQDPGALGEEEAAQFRYLIVSLMRNFENIHYQYCSGAISPDAWEGWSHRILAFSNQPGVIHLVAGTRNRLLIEIQGAYFEQQVEIGGESRGPIRCLTSQSSGRRRAAHSGAAHRRVRSH